MAPVSFGRVSATNEAGRPKQKVLGKRVKGLARTDLKGSRRRDIQEKDRKRQIVREWRQDKRSGEFRDERIGVREGEGTNEMAMTRRLQVAHLKRLKRKADFSLTDDIVDDYEEEGTLTIGGKSVRDISDDALEEDGFNLAAAAAADSDESNELDETAQPSKTRKEVYEEIIKKSKDAKVTAAREKARQEILCRELDEELPNMMEFLKFRADKKVNEDAVESVWSVASTDVARRTIADDKVYDEMVKLASHEKKAVVSDRIKTPQELAEARLKRLKLVEEARLAVIDEQEALQREKARDGEMTDSDAETSDRGEFSDDETMKRGNSEEEGSTSTADEEEDEVNEEENEADGDEEGQGDEKEEEQGDEKKEEQEEEKEEETEEENGDDEPAADDGSFSVAQNEPQGEEEEHKSNEDRNTAGNDSEEDVTKKELNGTSEDEEDSGEAWMKNDSTEQLLPFTIESCPSSYEDLKILFDGWSYKSQWKILHRLRVCMDVKPDKENERRMERFSALLLNYLFEQTISMSSGTSGFSWIKTFKKMTNALKEHVAHFLTFYPDSLTVFLIPHLHSLSHYLLPEMVTQSIGEKLPENLKSQMMTSSTQIDDKRFLLTLFFISVIIDHGSYDAERTNIPTLCRGLLSTWASKRFNLIDWDLWELVELQRKGENVDPERYFGDKIVKSFDEVEIIQLALTLTWPSYLLYHAETSRDTHQMVTPQLAELISALQGNTSKDANQTIDFFYCPEYFLLSSLQILTLRRLHDKYPIYRTWECSLLKVLKEPFFECMCARCPAVGFLPFVHITLPVLLYITERYPVQQQSGFVDEFIRILQEKQASITPFTHPPLALQERKPQGVKFLTPVFFDPKASGFLAKVHPGPKRSSEQIEHIKLKREVATERRAAARQIRRDAEVVELAQSAVRAKHNKKQDAEQKRILAMLSADQADFKKMRTIGGNLDTSVRKFRKSKQIKRSNPRMGGNKTAKL